jgi:DNA-binding response OmpR family regulator
MNNTLTPINTSLPVMELSLLVAVSYYAISDDLREQLLRSGIRAKITPVATIQELETELRKDKHHFIITEYSLGRTDVWRMAKLVNSNQLSQHALPIYLVKDEVETDIPLLLAKQQGFKVVDIEEIGATLKADYVYNHSQGYTRGRILKEKHTLLAIEDDEDAAELIRHNLNEHYHIDIAHTGEAGLALWMEYKHDLVLLDYNLPVMQGDEVLEQIMRVDENQPVIIMTAYDLPDRNRNMILNGASEYLCKPFEMEALKERCQTILNRARLIYQMHYTETKKETLGNLLWLLDHHLSHNQIDKAKQIMKVVKLLIPFLPPEDEQIDLLDKEL